MTLRIPENSLLRKFFNRSGIEAYLPSVAVKHIIAFITAMSLKGFRAKMVDVAEVSNCHRTTLSRFLSEGQWDDQYLNSFIKTNTYRHVYDKAISIGEPMFISIDDTVNFKTKPSSKAVKPIQGAGFHYSHLKSKQMWGHEVVSIMLSSGDLALNYESHLYDKTKQTKIDYIRSVASELPDASLNAYVLSDSWYTCAELLNAFAEKGYNYIGAIKNNRIIYPDGDHISVTDYVLEVLVRDDYDLVTVKGVQYYTYRYEGRLNDINNAAVIITIPKEGGFDGPHPNPNTINTFICTDVSLDTVTLLEYYSKRWCIETFFEEHKGRLGFDKYQIRSIKAIQRLWLLMSLCRLICCVGLGQEYQFGDGLRVLRKSVKDSRIDYIYKCAQNNIPVSEVYAVAS